MTVHSVAGVGLALLMLVIAEVTPTAGGGPGVPQASRSNAVRLEFRRLYPCPATAKYAGPCPGYEIDHRTPLCLAGADRVDNLQWLTTEAHKRKTLSDARLCRNRTP